MDGDGESRIPSDSGSEDPQVTVNQVQSPPKVQMEINEKITEKITEKSEQNEKSDKIIESDNAKSDNTVESDNVESVKTQITEITKVGIEPEPQSEITLEKSDSDVDSDSNEIIPDNKTTFTSAAIQNETREPQDSIQTPENVQTKAQTNAQTNAQTKAQTSPKPTTKTTDPEKLDLKQKFLVLRKLILDRALTHTESVETILSLLVQDSSISTGSNFDIETNYVIESPIAITSLVDLLEICPEQVSAEIWSIFIIVCKKCDRTLLRCREVKLGEIIIQKLQKTEGIISDLFMDLITVLFQFSISMNEFRLLYQQLCTDSCTGKLHKHSSRLLQVLTTAVVRDNGSPDAYMVVFLNVVSWGENGYLRSFLGQKRGFLSFSGENM